LQGGCEEGKKKVQPRTARSWSPKKSREGKKEPKQPREKPFHHDEHEKRRGGSKFQHAKKAASPRRVKGREKNMGDRTENGKCH